MVHRPVNVPLGNLPASSQQVTWELAGNAGPTTGTESGFTVKKIPKLFVWTFKYEKHSSMWHLDSILFPCLKHISGSPLLTGWCLRPLAWYTKVSVLWVMSSSHTSSLTTILIPSPPTGIYLMLMLTYFEYFYYFQGICVLSHSVSLSVTLSLCLNPLPNSVLTVLQDNWVCIAPLLFYAYIYCIPVL